MLLTSGNFLLPSNIGSDFYSFGNFFTYVTNITNYLKSSVQSVGAFCGYIINMCPSWLKYAFGFCLAYLILLLCFKLLRSI